MELSPNRTENFLIVVDNFYSDPKEVRDFALRQDFTNGRPYYPGVRSQRCVTSQVQSYLQELVRTPLDWSERFCGVFQIMTADDYADSYIHHDATDWAGVVYLSEREAPGTIFYRHKLSGFSSMPTTTQAFRRANELKMSQIELQHSFQADARDESKWEPVFQTEFKFNRLVLYPGQHFHKNAESWGLHKDDSRLTQVFFLRVR